MKDDITAALTILAPFIAFIVFLAIAYLAVDGLILDPLWILDWIK